MSNLWICREQIAEKPFFLKEEELNIRTLEELCFYLFHNMDNLDEELIGEELFSWLSEELKMPRLATVLQQERQQGKPGIWCAWFLLREAGMYSSEELEELREFCFTMANKDEFERQKLKADRLLKNKRYLRSIKEYQALLQKDDKKPEHRKLRGDICHNMGVAHARLFLFAEAAECFERAYEQNQRSQSLESYAKARELMEQKNHPEQMEEAEPEHQGWDECLRQLREEYKKKVI